MKTTYKTKGTCSSQIDVEIEDGVVKAVQFLGGCDGNLQAVSKLVTGMDAREAKERLQGIRCGRKSTSCPDQLSKAIASALGDEA
jgi:uncharacterized protein (TIGR03905 family)